MPTVRLLVVLLSVPLSAALARAQFSQQDNSAAIQWWNSASSGSSGSAGALVHSEPSTPLDRIMAQYQLQRLPRIFVVPREEEAQADVLCYSIRSYLVVRNSPDSDTTHTRGYSTCQPATRFRVHSIRGRIPSTP